MPWAKGRQAAPGKGCGPVPVSSLQSRITTPRHGEVGTIGGPVPTEQPRQREQLHPLLLLARLGPDTFRTGSMALQTELWSPGILLDLMEGGRLLQNAHAYLAITATQPGEESHPHTGEHVSGLLRTYMHKT